VNSSTPSALELVLAFANTHADAGDRVERFTDAEGLTTWLAEVAWSGAEPARTVTDSDVVEARELRDALVTVLLSHSSDGAASGPQVRSAEAILERAGDRCPVAVRLSGAEARLGPGCGGVAGAFAGVLAAATELALSGQWARIKACRNEPCHFAFFDRSKNTSAGYCSTQCSSQASMRAYRARKKEALARNMPSSVDDANVRSQGTRTKR
jgi:predicted RNA-binding Zn ribbon-like protein